MSKGYGIEREIEGLQVERLEDMKYKIASTKIQTVWNIEFILDLVFVIFMEGSIYE